MSRATMPISLLPKSTVRLLGSSVAITTPCGLVKELIENSIDAKATSIEVTASANTIDKIQVKDDGHGIDVDDFDALGRRAHTSKLRTFDELRDIGGQTLGFRGEALASVNSLSTVTITTRTRDDPVASRMVLRSGDGGVRDKRPVSAPVGTTVQATDLFEKLLVRRRCALKEAPSTISQIKDVLKRYALARPHLKLSFKVSRDPKSLWSYAPNRSPNIREAVLQVFGHVLVSNCTETMRGSGTYEKVLVRRCDLPMEFILEAFIPKFGCNIEAIKGTGSFISVDSRPLSPTSEFSKKITGKFKSHFSESLGTAGSTKVPASPFMQLNVRCPPGSYDPNVTPLKDEVLFADAKTVVDCFETLCREMYTRKKSMTDEWSGVTGNTIEHASGLSSTTLQNFTPINQRHSPDQTRNLPVNEDIENFADAFALDDAEALSLLESVESTASTAGPVRHVTDPPGLLQVHFERSTIHQTQDESQLLHAEQPMLRPTDRSPCEGSSFLPVKMRTTKSVNMARTESEVTDEYSMSGLIDVQLPPRRASAERTSAPKPRLSTRPNQLKVSCRMDGIEQYLERSQNGNFEIASDETATVGDCEPASNPAESLKFRSNGTVRQPLMPLTESDLNRIGGQAELEDVSSETEPEVLQPYQNLRRDLDGRFVNRHRGDTQSPGHRVRSPFPLDSSPVGQQLLHHFDSTPRQLASGNQPFATPPPSDPVRRGRAANPAFRPPQTNIAAIESVEQNGQRNRRTGVRADDNASRRSVNGTVDRHVSGAATIGERHHHQNQRVPANHSPLLSSIIRDGPQETEHMGLLRPQAELFQAASRHHDVSAHHEDEAESHEDSRYSHMSQVLLMRTPLPVMSARTHNTEEARLGKGRLPDISRAASPRHDGTLSGCNRSMSRNSATSEQDGDAGRYLILRQRSQSRHERPRRPSSRKLPLETVPTEEQTKRMSMTVQLQLQDLESWTQTWAKLESQSSAGHSESSLQFKHMPEAQLAEQRLRTVVDAWARSKGMEMDVEYTLVRGAKGKGKAQ